MAIRTWMLAGLASLTVVVSAACDKDGGASGSQGEAPSEAEGAGGGEAAPAETEAAEPDLSDPRQLGETIGQHYVDMMLRVRELVADRPEIATLRPQLEALKEQYIQIFVELGHRVEALDRTQRSPVDSAVMAKMRELPDFDWFNAAMEHYRPLDNDFANFIASFNVMTQYAFFELLRQQEPEEARRLGVGQ